MKWKYPLVVLAIFNNTHPLKKVKEPTKIINHLTVISGVIYQANYEMGGPENDPRQIFGSRAKIVDEIG